MMQHYSRSKGRYGRKKTGYARLVRQVAGSQVVNISRWQRCSNVANDGSTPLKWFYWNQTPIGSAGDNRWYYPCHVFPLTEYLGNGSVRLPWGAHQLRSDTQDYSWVDILSQDNTGGIGSTNGWKIEKGPHTACATAFHEWTSIKLRLFGSYGYPTNFKVMVIQVPDENAVPGYAQPANEKATEMANYLARSCCGSSMSGGTSGIPLPFKVLKSYTYDVDSLDKSDEAAAVGATVPLTKEGNYKDVSLFLRHDRVRSYTWRHTQMPLPVTSLPNTWDTTDQTVLSKEPDIKPSQRLFLVLMANVSTSCAPLQQTGVDTIIGQTTVESHLIAERRFQPAYDIIMRNKFVTTS